MFALGTIHLTSALALLATLSSTMALPVVEERHVVEIVKRQSEIGQLLQLASLAGITALPTDPALLLSLGPLANSLASALPTPSVLSVLITAAPSDFVSNIVNNPSYAASFESAFSAGSSPSWFTALPTDVKSYLHTYSGFGGIAGAAGALNTAAAAGGAGSNATGGAGSSANATASASSMSMSGSMSSMSMSMSMSGTSSMSSSMTGTGAGAGAGSSSSSKASSSTSTAGAARPTGAYVTGVLGAVGAGFIGLVAAL